jgi:fucose permease
LVDNARGPIFPDILREFSLSDSAGSFFFFTSSGTALINNVLAFRWMERAGPFRTTVIYSVSLVIGLVIMAAAPVFPVQIIGCVFFGASLGGLGLSVNLLVAAAVIGENRRRALAGLHGMYGIASLLSPLLITVLYLEGMSWRAVLMGGALTPVGVLLLIFYFRKASPKATTNFNSELRSTQRSRKTALFFATLLTCYVIAEISLSTRLALFARREAGFSVESANALLTFFFVGIFVGRFLVAAVKLRLESRTVLILSASSGLLTYSLGLLGDPRWLGLCGFALSVFYPCAIALINDECGENGGYVTSWCITLQSLGLMLMHFAIGRLSDSFGLRAALWIGPICLGATLVGLFWMRSRARNPASP